jgi:Protein of unknown function (DUF974)
MQSRPSQPLSSTASPGFGPAGTRRPAAMDRPGAHPLTFRVMRLTAATPSRRPTLPFVSSVPTTYPQSSSLADSRAQPDEFLRGAPRHEGEGAPASVGVVSILPASFGSIYAAETFRSFISTYNHTSSPVRGVSVSIDIQTASQRRISVVAAPPPKIIPSHEAVSHVVSAPLPELGVHVLICSASYLDASGATCSMKQHFRFNVLPPLEPFVNVVPLQRNRIPPVQQPVVDATLTPTHIPYAEFLVDLRVLNTMPVPVYITSAILVANAPYTVVSSLTRPDDPAAQQSPHPPSTTNADLDLQSDSDSSTDGLPPGSGPAEAPDAGAIPIRAASTGVGDTRNFLFYVARPFDASEHPAPSLSPAPSSQGQRVPGLARTDAARTQRYSRSSYSAPSPSKSLPGIPASPGASSATLAASPSIRSARRTAPDAAPVRREIGFFSLAWHSGSGEHGRMDNIIAAFEPVVRAVDVELRIVAVPQDIHVQAPFAARCVARNNSAKTLRLYLQVRRDLVGEIVPVGISGVSIGELAPDETAECLLTLIPLSRGQHSISGLRIVDIDSQRAFNAEAPVVSVL